MSVLVAGWGGCLVAGLGLWLWSVVRRDASVVDIWWGLGFVGLVGWYRSQGPEAAWWHLAQAGMVTVWGVRLAVHIWWRGRGQGEDHRYAAMRKHHGARFWWVSLVTVFGLQATLVAALAAPLLAVQAATSLDFPILFWLGLALWFVGFAFEAVADWQLQRFKADPNSRGKVLDRGLWRYSRHPNYFGEAVLWWGYGLTAVAAGGAWTLFSPLVVTLLLLKVSGVVLLEKTIGSRRPEYAEYTRRTSAFLPRPPRPSTMEAAS